MALLRRGREPGPGVEPWVRRFLGDAVEQHRLPGRAWVVLGRPQQQLYAERQQCLVAVDPGDPEALAWTAGVLADLHGRVDDRFLIRLEPAYAPLIPRLLDAGFRLHKLQLRGPVSEALAALEASPGSDPGALGETFVVEMNNRTRCR